MEPHEEDRDQRHRVRRDLRNVRVHEEDRVRLERERGEHDARGELALRGGIPRASVAKHAPQQNDDEHHHADRDPAVGDRQIVSDRLRAEDDDRQRADTPDAGHDQGRAAKQSRSRQGRREQ
jgi:hypothetical protein